ncbi:hypothetical protein PENTCL1PPCAC_19108, partial [Pristionchus entomophagus]
GLLMSTEETYFQVLYHSFNMEQRLCTLRVVTCFIVDGIPRLQYADQGVANDVFFPESDPVVEGMRASDLTSNIHLD